VRGVAEPAWTAERVVTAGEAAALLRRQFPALRAASVEPLAEGWDRPVHVVDGRWAFRFPRRAMALPGVAREVAVLPSIAAALPLPVPVPAFAGVPSGA
jgi:aminoglycoside phosphotransferase (APT) family kinase protein